MIYLIYQSLLALIIMSVVAFSLGWLLKHLINERKKNNNKLDEQDNFYNQPDTKNIYNDNSQFIKELNLVKQSLYENEKLIKTQTYIVHWD